MNFSDGEWKQVKPRRVRKRKIFPLNNYWNGFDSNGKERWFAELNDGRIITPRHEEYYRIVQKHR